MGWKAPSLSGFIRFTCVAAAVTAALPLGGCSYQLGSLWGKNKQDDAEVTGSIRTSPLNAQAELVPDRSMPPQADMRYARAAALDVLSRGGKDASQPWENPETGARGSATPLASAYTSDSGLTCRDFLVSYVKGASEAWLQGDACRSEDSKWEIRSLRTWKKS